MLYDNHMYILALDVGGTAIKSALTKNGVMMKTHESPSEGNSPITIRT